MKAEWEIREAARKILKEGRVSSILGWRKVEWSPKAVIHMATSSEEAALLTFGPLCHGSPTNFVKRIEGVVAVVARGCDSRAINVLLQEEQVRREELVVIGVRCRGMLDLRKLSALLGREPPPDLEAEVRGEEVLVRVEGEEKPFGASEVLRRSCLSCEHPEPVVYDILLGEEAREPFSEPYAEVEQFEHGPPDERWAFWEEEFRRCVRCFACRNICPLCYCERCVFQAYSFLDKSSNPVSNALFHLVRAMHMAGRCVDCGECEAVCPEGLPLTLLYKRLEREVRERFEYIAGLKGDLPPLLGTFRPEDEDEFVR